VTSRGRRDEVETVLALVDEAFDHPSWHGTNLRGAIRGVDARAAAWRPRAGRHNIWELVVHAAYWKYAVRRRLTGEKRGSFALQGSNWFVRPEPGAASPRARNAAFKADVRLLAAEHRALREVVASLSPASLAVRVGQYDRTYLIRGIAAHDLYHAGQIQLLKRLGR